MFNVQRAITPKVGKPELQIICSARLIVHYICVNCRENITDDIGVMERTRVLGRNGCVQSSKGNNFISKQSRVMVRVFCTSSYSALHWCEFRENISNGIRVMERT